MYNYGAWQDRERETKSGGVEGERVESEKMERGKMGVQYSHQF